MHAFIIRPFGVKNGIDFDRVEQELISPALRELGFSGGTTVEFIQQGNIRTDMFEQLLIADLVVADISIHNANAFYELGIRHAFRDKRTFLIKSAGDEVPFDLKTDRYLPYDADKPADSLSALTAALKATWESEEQDSPVFQLLPGLEATDPARFMPVPRDFQEKVQRFEKDKAIDQMNRLRMDVDGLDWKLSALRLIGNAQFRLKDFAGAKTTWAQVRGYDRMDLEANTKLGTVFQKLGDIVASDQALARAIQNPSLENLERAEIKALMGSNAKALWRQDWENLEDTNSIQKAALTSGHLERSFELYRRGFIADRNHFYSGLNALSMLTIMIELATTHPDEWEAGFDFEDEADLKLRKLKVLQSDLRAGVKLSIESKRASLERHDKTDIWAEISSADLAFLSSSNPKRVKRAYKVALMGAPDFAMDSARKQLVIFERLGILSANVQAALAYFDETAMATAP
jgi:hypothetical protein